MKARLLIVLIALPVWVSATQIQWYSTPGMMNEDSMGQAMDSSFYFELGAFQSGFTPSSENMDQWAENWIPVQRVQYDIASHWFTAVYNVTSSTPIPQGADAYIWGFSGDPANGEWLLCRDNSWKWPKANSNRPIPRVWNVTNAKVVVLGEVNNGQVTLKTVTVSNVNPPETTWKQWAKEHLGNPNADPSGDTNGNGIQDVLEFVAGLEDPDAEPRGLEIKISKESGASILELLIPKRKDRPADIRIEISPDLDQWYDASDVVNLHSNKPLELIFRDTAGVTDMAGPWYWRYSVTPEE